MKRSFLMLLWLLLGSGMAAAADVAIIAEGKSDYQIIYPDDVGNQHLNLYHRQAAEMLAQALLCSTAVALPVRAEKDLAAGQPGLYIGACRALSAAGLGKSSYQRWEHHLVVKGKDVFMFGDDWRGGVYPDSSRHNYCILGSYKSTLTFLEKFAGALFMGGAALADSVPKRSSITIPEDYHYDRIPQIQYCISRGKDINYDLANNFLPSPWYGSHGGHSHSRAILQDKYFATNPEYFALRKGKRVTHPTRPQYCFSNPQVREMIYQEVLEHLDKGYEIVQLAQSDGFWPCECPDCAALYGVESFGEKIWIMHREMAVRLQKDRPGRKVCIIAYGPTRIPPQTFKDFPDNVVIELAPYSDEIMASWQGYQVPGGFVVYLYNWGYYKPEGFMPKQSWQFCQQQLEKFHASNVKGIYRCGFGELFGLEGPTYYIWGKLLDDPKADPRELLQQYCQRVYAEGVDAMQKFFQLLDERLQLVVSKSEIDWNDPELLAGGLSLTRHPVQVIQTRYPDAVVAELENLLTAAEQKNQSFLLQRARLEFDYLKHTARAANALGRFRTSCAPAEAQSLFASLAARKLVIDSLPCNKSGNLADGSGYSLFGGATPQLMRMGGRLSGPLYAPFQWDGQWMLDRAVVPAGRTIRVGDSTVQYLVPENYMAEDLEQRFTKAGTRIFCRSGESSLQVIFILSPVVPQEDFAKHILRVTLGPEKKGLFSMPGRCKNGSRASCYKLVKTNLENAGKGDVYEAVAGNKTVITIPAPGVGTAPGEVAIEFNIPYESMPRPPRHGETWLFNACYGSGDIHGSSTWEHNFNQETWRNTRDSQGKIVF
ncbi:MAG: DUF4838 domain-containing protein [Oligosphaeraceae bacterium]|nr:DUF4838 domain-containing protein [Oligosphaeraceae bacterium]